MYLTKLSLVPCPDPACDAPAEVTDRVTMQSTSGPVDHMRTQCLHRHIFFMPVPVAQPVPSGQASSAFQVRI
jgi:hypothetical protein